MTTIQEGKKAPAFTLPSSEGGKTKLSEHAGKYVVLYFYPKDDTPGCTTEAKDFQAALPKLAKLDAVVLGVSKDSVEKHLKFKSKHGLEFPLLTDEDGSVLAKFGAWGEKNMYGKKMMGIIRTTVVIAPDGKIVKVFPKVRVAGHVDQVVQVIEAHRPR